MLISDARKIRFRGKRATLRVLRNNGYCWGHITCGTEQFDVESDDDQYDCEDSDALDAFESAAKNRKRVTRAITQL